MVICCLVIGYILIGAIISIGILVYDNLHDNPYQTHKEEDDYLKVMVMLVWPALIPWFIGFIVNKLLVKISDHITNAIKERKKHEQESKDRHGGKLRR